MFEIHDVFTVAYILLITKHLIIDFFLQTPWMLAHKGIYGRPGGIIHAALHGFTSLTALSPTLPIANMPIRDIFTACLVEAVVHYHIDWCKCRITANHGPDTKSFWRWLGIDQFLHQLTYIVMASTLVRMAM